MSHAHSRPNLGARPSRKRPLRASELLVLIAIDRAVRRQGKCPNARALARMVPTPRRETVRDAIGELYSRGLIFCRARREGAWADYRLTDDGRVLLIELHRSSQHLEPAAQVDQLRQVMSSFRR